MLFMSLCKWWYGLGWRDQYQLAVTRFFAMADFFSIGLSIRTLFSPFKQIDAERAGKGSLDIMLRAWFDQLFSRLFGAFMRSILVLIGCIVLAIEVIVGLIRLALWPLLPFAPFLLLFVTLAGWGTP